jgi:predicted pyridoxine 5'-phosphate oxidase superfamily flavin-nucleotide-binding protein
MPMDEEKEGGRSSALASFVTPFSWTNPGRTQSHNGWHPGERAAQARAGVAEKMAEYGPRVLRPTMSDQHRAFFAQLPFVLVGAVDDQGRPWASVLSAEPPFAWSPDPETLRLAALPSPGDPLAAALQSGAALGLLGIELPTRRRNRLNGRVGVVDAKGFTLFVEQSFGNCPQFIHARDYAGTLSRDNVAPVAVEPFEGLPTEAATLIVGADTCFVASAAAPESNGRFAAVDVSHRGGMPGFLKLARDGAVDLPDYRGNYFFNTIGNLLSYPRAGLLFIDFESGDLLQLTGEAEVIWEGDALAAHAGAKRLCRIRPVVGRWLRRAFPLRLSFREVSPQAVAAVSRRLYSA